MKTYSFEKLDAWQESRKLAGKIYRLTKLFPDDEKFGLVSQMRRCSISISSNIAEATSRYSGKDQVRFYEIAYGSLMELLNQAIISSDLMMLVESDLKDARKEIDSIAHKLTKLADAQRKRND